MAKTKAQERAEELLARYDGFIAKHAELADMDAREKYTIAAWEAAEEVAMDLAEVTRELLKEMER